MTASWSKPLRATLCVGRSESRLIWSYGDRAGHVAVPSEGCSPQAIVKRAVMALQQEASKMGANTRRAQWRLCLSGGFYAPAKRPAGRWSIVLSAAAAIDLERVCPVPLDELQAAAVPMNQEKAWVCGFDRATLSKWKTAAEELKIAFEGAWTHAAAISDFFLEHGNGSEPLDWQDGFARVELTPGPEPSLISKIRVYAWRGSPEATGIHEIIAQAAPAELLCDCPVHALPGLALHILEAADPSESLNLLRGDLRTSPVDTHRQRPFAAALVLCSIAMVILALGSFVKGQSASREAIGGQRELSAAWHQTHGQLLLPPLAVTTMEQEVANWRAARAELPVFNPHKPGIPEVWAMLVESLPKDLQISVSSLRNRRGELWIEGEVKNQADARKLESAWNSLAALKSDPMRLSAGSGGLVNFSMRMVLR